MGTGGDDEDRRAASADTSRSGAHHDAAGRRRAPAVLPSRAWRHRRRVCDHLSRRWCFEYISALRSWSCSSRWRPPKRREAAAARSERGMAGAVCVGHWQWWRVRSALGSGSGGEVGARGGGATRAYLTTVNYHRTTKWRLGFHDRTVEFGFP